MGGGEIEEARGGRRRVSEEGEEKGRAESARENERNTPPFWSHRAFSSVFSNDTIRRDFYLYDVLGGFYDFYDEVGEFEGNENACLRERMRRESSCCRPLPF